MLENDFYEKQSTTDRPDIFDFVVNLEVLQGCPFTCAGCHVDKINLNANIDLVLENAYANGKYFVGKGMRFREIFVGATDIFKSLNSVDVLSHPTLHKLAKLKGAGDILTTGNTVGDQNLGLTSTAIFDGLEIEDIEKIFNVLDNPNFYREKMTVELLIPVDVQKILNKDQKFIDDHHRAIEWFEKNTPKHVIFSFINNIYKNKHLMRSGIYDECKEFYKTHFNAIMEHNPSFFRSGSDAIIGKNIKVWKDILEICLEEDEVDINDIHLTAVDLHHNSFNTLGLHFKEERAYLIPFIYENIFLEREKFLIREANNPKLASEKYAELMSEGFKYASDCTSCSDCEMLVACVGRNVQNVMKEFEMKDCIFPKQFREKFNPSPRG